MVSINGETHINRQEAAMPEQSPNKILPIVEPFFAPYSQSPNRVEERLNVMKSYGPPSLHGRVIIVQESGKASIELTG
jgi:hypothetical protein